MKTLSKNATKAIKRSRTKRAPHRLSTNVPSRAERLYSIMKKAKDIRQKHAEGDITAEEAGKQLSKLYNRSSTQSTPSRLFTILP